ncbi:MAG TPA: hypothetical protein VFN09_10650 [Rhodanobacteraceae bacterium]|nr:hypothetical protein [Rhodanobacteraceae bacterium]
MKSQVLQQFVGVARRGGAAVPSGAAIICGIALWCTAPAVLAAVAVGGPGVESTGNATVTTRANIAGGLAADGVTRAHAVAFSGGGNRLTLENGYSFTGLVVSDGAGDTLALGGDSGGTGSGSGSFDVAEIGASAQFRGFSNYAKSGTSTWTLTGSNASTHWMINAGALLVTGTVGDVDANVGAVGGTGTVAAITLDADGVIAPGGSPGTLHGTNLNWNGGGGFDFELGSSPATSDLLALSGSLTKGAGSGFVFHFADAGSAPTAGSTYTLITFASVAGFSVSDFSNDYNGGAPLNGNFVLTSTALQFVVAMATQTITFANPGGQQLAAGSVSLNPTASSGLPVTLVSTTTSVCTVAGTGPFTVNLVGAGTCSLTASQPGDGATVAAATPVTVSFAVAVPFVPVPTLGSGALALLIALLGWLGFRRRRPV